MNYHGRLNYQRISFFSVVLLAFCLQAKEQQGVIELSGKQDYDEYVLQSTKPVVVKFYMPSCGACKAIKETYHNLADKYQGSITFVAVESSNNADLSKAHNKHGAVPYFQFYDYENGKLSKNGELVGAPRDPKDLESAILGSMPSMQKKLTAAAKKPAEPVAPVSAKRKAEEPLEAPVAKKQKVEEPMAKPASEKAQTDEYGVVEIVGQDQFNQEVLNSSIPVVVKFYTTWCSPCKMINPGIQELAQRNKGKIKFVFVDADKSKEVHEKYRAEPGVPHFVFFKNGKKDGFHTGGGSLSADNIEKLFSSKTSIFGKSKATVTTRPMEELKKPAKAIESAVKVPVRAVQETTRKVTDSFKQERMKQDYMMQEDMPAKKSSKKSKRTKYGFKRSRSCATAA